MSNMAYTYIQTTDKNGKARFYKVDENGKRKVISRSEYEVNTAGTAEVPAADQISMEAVTIEATATEAVEIEVPAVNIDAAEGETVYTDEPIAPKTAETCTALVVPFNLDAAITELRERERLSSLDLTVPSVEETALDTVKAIISGLGGKHAKKVRLQETKRGTQIRYRNCTVCALVFNDEHTLTGIRFMGTTMETLNEATVYEPVGLSNYRDMIVEQVAFIDWQWANVSRAATA